MENNKQKTLEDYLKDRRKNSSAQSQRSLSTAVHKFEVFLK